MKISTKGRYGLEALIVMCLESEQGHVNLKRISERCNVSEAYILQIFLVLRRAGIVESVRGAQGGYYLARKPEEISVADVLNALEGPMSPVTCIIESNDRRCERFPGCATRILWEKVKDGLDAFTGGLSLRDLLQKYLTVNPELVGPEDYCI